MARVFPSDLSKLALAGAHRPELATLALLRKRLPDGYTVFHGVHWSREYAKWTHFGEVDFVVVNRSGDVLLVEQKNGALVEADGGLVKQYEDGDKNVNDQIRRSLEKVREKFKWQHPSAPKLRLDYLIYCPDHRVVKVNAVSARHEPYRRRRREGWAGRTHSVGAWSRVRRCGRSGRDGPGFLPPDARPPFRTSTLTSTRRRAPSCVGRAALRSCRHASK